MNETLATILKRRSIRKYTGSPVGPELIAQLLEAAMSAPSAANQQPWHFIVVNDRSLLKNLATIHSGYQMLNEAPVAIVVCGEEGLATLKCYWALDCAAATENILIAAVSLGLGALWCGVYPVEENIGEVRQFLNIPAHLSPFSLIPLGWPAEEKTPAQRFSKSRIHFNQNYQLA